MTEIDPEFVVLGEVRSYDFHALDSRDPPH